MSDRDLGVALIRLWFENNNVVQGALSFSDVISFYDRQSPSHIEAIGKAVRIASLSQDDEKRALARVRPPGDDPQALPNYQAFFTALADQEIDNSGFTWTHVSQAVGQGVAQTVTVVEKTAVVAGAGYLIYLLGGLAITAYFMSRKEKEPA